MGGDMDEGAGDDTFWGGGDDNDASPPPSMSSSTTLPRREMVSHSTLVHVAPGVAVVIGYIWLGEEAIPAAGYAKRSS